jgi:hypothetical protein
MVHQSSAYVHGATWASHGKDKDMVSGAGDTVDPVAGAGDHVGHGVPIALTAGGHTEHGTILGFDPHKAMYYVSGGGRLRRHRHAAFVLAPRRADRGRRRATRMDAVVQRDRARSSTWAEDKWLRRRASTSFVIVMPLRVISHLFHWFDKLVIDGIVVLVNGTAKLPKAALGIAQPCGRRRPGLLHGYALRMIGRRGDRGRARRVALMASCIDPYRHCLYRHESMIHTRRRGDRP